MSIIYSNYRAIWEEHYGAIPCDSEGRTYEIHHIDGDRTNNAIENLLCVSIKEHYKIHYTQGDIGACQMMLFRMSRTPEETSALQSELTTLNNNKRVAAGTHNFLDAEWRENHFDNRVTERVENGTHNFLGDGSFQREVQMKRLEEGRHNFGSDYAKERERKKKERDGSLIQEIKDLVKKHKLKLRKSWHSRHHSKLVTLHNDITNIFG